MAGFADEIAHFNPYVSQIPSDDYVNAGMMMQRKYDEGVSRAQGAIDNVAGLQVVGEANSQYLRGKMGELETKVSKIVGSDFAKNSVSNQVGQLSSLISRDPIVQAGVTSAVRYQKYVKSWDDLKKDHPDQYSDRNREYSDQYWNDYFKQSQTKAGLVANGPTDATPYVDYYDKLDKQLKGIDPSIQTSITPAGEFMYKIDKSSTVSRDQVDGVLRSAMMADPRMQNQMQIDSWASYKSFDGLGMFDHISKSFNGMINSYQDHAKYYQDLIKANPNDYNTVTAAQKKIVDFNTEIKNLSSNRDTYLDEINKGNLDGVKQAVFSESVRQGLILKYERNNITTDLKNNENSIEGWKNHWEGQKLGIEQEKLGIEREKLRIEEIKARLKGQVTVQPVSIAGQVPDTYTQDQHDIKIAGIQDNINGALGTFRSTYYPNLNDTQWKSYLSTQETKFQAGDPSTDSFYRELKKSIAPQEVTLNGLKEASNKITTDANKKFAVGDSIPENTRFSGIEVTDEDGTKRKTDIVANKDVVRKSIELRNSIYNHMSTTGNGGLDVTPQVNFPSAEEIKKETDKYKSDPNYKYIVALATTPKDALDQQAAKLRDLNSKKEDYIKNEFSNLGRTVSYQGNIIEGKKEEIDWWSRLVSTSGDQQAKELKFENIEPQNYYNNDKGELVVQYKDKKDGKMYETTVPTQANIVGNPDPYQYLARAIDLSPTKSTSLDPKNALSSENGKLKYAIQKNPFNGTYQLRLWNKGALYNIQYNASNLGSYIERMEQLSQLPPAKLDELMKTTFGQQN